VITPDNSKIHERKFRQFIHYFKNILLIIVLIFVLVLITRALTRLYSKYTVVLDSYEEVESRYITQRDRLTSLEQEVLYLSTERGREDKIRQRYRVISPGEKIIIVVEE
jgi:cell division protein FtsB